MKKRNVVLAILLFGAFGFSAVLLGRRRITDHPWDLNGDGVVDDLDQAIFEAAYGSTPADANWNPACDFDGDGLVSYDDLAALGRHFGETY
jgi:hypothetical protein